MTEIDFSIPYWLLNCYHIIGAISLLFDAFSIYLILFESSKIDNFRFYLLNFQIVCCLFDIHLTFLFQPVPLYPLVSGFMMGVLTYFGGTMYTCMLASVALVIYQVESIVFCFIKKHQTVATTLRKYILPRWFVWGLFIFFASALSGVLVCFAKTTVAEDKKFDYVAKTFPQYLESLKTLPNFSIYIADDYFFAVVLSAVSMGIFTFFILCLIIFNIFRMLNLLKTQISASNYQRHRIAIWSLLAQFATSSVCFVPPIFYVFVVLIGIDGAQLIVEYLVVVASLHSSFNVSVLVLTFPPYRKFVLSLIRRKKKEVRVGIAVLSMKPSVVISHH